VNAHRKPPFRRRRLGKRLRALREAAGQSLDEAAARLDKSRSALHRIETGQTRADVHLIRSMMDLYDIYEEDLLDQAREVLKPRRFPWYGKADSGYVDAEADACQVLEFSVINVPGLLQTERYMRALFQAHQSKRARTTLDSAVAVRLTRQQRLTSEYDPIELVAIVDEAALRREVGGPEVMRDQLHHLIEISALPTATVQVLPLCDGAHTAMNGAFVLLAFPEPEDRTSSTSST
jgi:transcriptional regulator with XRE-family HTH domain